MVEEDAADAKARRAAEAEAARAAEELKKSAALRRGLPRPASLDGLPAPRPPAEVARMSYREKAEHSLAVELMVGSAGV
jgi:hypothetical protein